MFGNRTFNGTISERISEEPTVLIFPVTFFLIWVLFLIWGALKGKITKKNELLPFYLYQQGTYFWPCKYLALESFSSRHLRALITRLNGFKFRFQIDTFPRYRKSSHFLIILLWPLNTIR